MQNIIMATFFSNLVKFVARAIALICFIIFFVGFAAIICANYGRYCPEWMQWCGIKVAETYLVLVALMSTAIILVVLYVISYILRNIAYEICGINEYELYKNDWIVRYHMSFVDDKPMHKYFGRSFVKHHERQMKKHIRIIEGKTLSAFVYRVTNMVCIIILIIWEVFYFLFLED